MRTQNVVKEYIRILKMQKLDCIIMDGEILMYYVSWTDIDLAQGLVDESEIKENTGGLQ